RRPSQSRASINLPDDIGSAPLGGSAHSRPAARSASGRSWRARLAAIERPEGRKHVVDRHGAPRARRLAKGGLVANRRTVRCPGCEECALYLGLEARVTRDVERMKKTGKWLGHDRA